MPPRLPDGPSTLSVITRLARGGSERRLFDAVSAVPGRHVVVVGRDSDPSQVARLPEGCEVVWCQALVREVDQRSDTLALRALVRLARRGRFDVVHTHQAKAGLLGRIAARAARVGVVYHSASMASFGPGYGRIESEVFARAERLTAPLVSRYFVVGADLARRLAANGVRSGCLQVVRSSLDLRPFLRTAQQEREDARAGFDVGPRAVVGYVGSLEARKGVLDLPELVERAARGRAATLLVAGDGPLRGRLEELAGRAPASLDVRLLGHVSDVARVMAAADVLVLPSSAEGLPQVLVQAAASGLPFVTFDIDGAAELLGAGAEGTAVALGDRAAFVDALAGWLDGVGRSGHPRANRLPARFWSAWDPAVVARQYREAYDADLAGAPRRR